MGRRKVKSIQVSVRVSEEIGRRIQELVDGGYYKSKADFVADAIREKLEAMGLLFQSSFQKSS